MTSPTKAVATVVPYARPVFLGVREVKAQIQRLLATHPDISADAQLLADSLEGQTSFNEVMERLVRLERDADVMAAAVKVEETRLAERRERFERQKEAWRAMMLQLMEAGGQHKLVLPVGTVSVSQGRPGCIVTDETKLADEYVKIERKPVKSLITAALLSGEKVAGAELRNSQPHITIRT